MQGKRNRLELYGDVLNALRHESLSDVIKPTKVQLISNLSYGKLMSILNDLEEKKLIERKSLKLEPKGQKYLEEYQKILDVSERIKSILTNDAYEDNNMIIDVNDNLLAVYGGKTKSLSKYHSLTDHTIRELEQISLFQKEIIREHQNQS